MSEVNEIRKGRHCVSKMHVHLVFVTKYRRKIFSKTMLLALGEILDSVCQDFEAELIEFDGEHDHIHLLVHYPPKVAVSRLVNSLKGVSSRYLRRMFPEIEQYYWNSSLWAPSYFAASCGGAPLNVIKQYIESQKTPA